MCVGTVVPVEETFNVDNIAGFEFANSLVNVCFSTCEVVFNNEVVCFAVLGKCNINVVAGLTILEGNFIEIWRK